jgi:hypothetical protein
MPQTELRAIVGRMVESGESEENIAAVIKRLSTPKSAPVAPAPEPDAGMGQHVKDVAIGAVKGLGNTAFGLGKMVRDYTPIGRISDAILPGAFDQRPVELEPTNTAQRVGFTAEQVGEFFVPGGGATKIAQVPKAAAITMAQTGSPAQAGVSGAITAAVPGAGTIARLAKGAKAGAEKSAAQALGATKEWAKVQSAKLAPEMIARGVKGSRDAMLETAKAQAKTIGTAMEEVIADAAARGTIVPGQVARQSIRAAQQALMVPSASGKLIPIEGAQAALGKLKKLDKFVERMGDAIPIEDAQRVKVAWDKIVSKAGLYGPKATASATDNADAWAIREAASSFRKLIAEASPDLATLNKEFAFWGGLRDVLKETAKRTQAQGGGLTSAVMGSSGAAAGFASGEGMGDSIEKALVGGVAGRQAIKLIQSPWFRTSVSAPLKNTLADALASGKTSEVLQAIGKITAAVPAQVRTAQ